MDDNYYGRICDDELSLVISEVDKLILTVFYNKGDVYTNLAEKYANVPDDQYEKYGFENVGDFRHVKYPFDTKFVGCDHELNGYIYDGKMHLLDRDYVDCYRKNCKLRHYDICEKESSNTKQSRFDGMVATTINEFIDAIHMRGNEFIIKFCVVMSPVCEIGAYDHDIDYDLGETNFYVEKLYCDNIVVIIMTNMANFYFERLVINYENMDCKLVDEKKSIITNVPMNPDFIDIAKTLVDRCIIINLPLDLSYMVPHTYMLDANSGKFVEKKWGYSEVEIQTLDKIIQNDDVVNRLCRQCNIISDNVKKYSCSENQCMKQRILTLEEENNAKTKEIEELKCENNELKKLAEIVETFKKSVAMMQLHTFGK